MHSLLAHTNVAAARPCAVSSPRPGLRQRIAASHVPSTQAVAAPHQSAVLGLICLSAPKALRRPHHRLALPGHSNCIPGVCNLTCSPSSHKSRTSLGVVEHQLGKQRLVQRRLVVSAAGRDGADPQPAAPADVEVAMFRFSAGLPFLEDKYIPRVAGVLMGTLLLINHSLSTTITPAQQVSELVGSILALLSIAIPSIETRLLELKGGRSAATPNTVGGTSEGGVQAKQQQVLVLSPALPQGTCQELAWASYALLRNTNACSLVLLNQGSIVCIRGLWNIPQQETAKSETPAKDTSGTPKGSSNGQRDAGEQLLVYQGQWDAVLVGSEALKNALEGGTGAGAPALGGEYLLGQTYVPSLGSEWRLIQTLCGSAASLIITAFDSRTGSKPSNDEETGKQATQSSALILISDRQRPFSPRDRQWIASLASKIALALSKS